MIDYKLKLFCLIAETKSFSKAATLSGMTQPGVSRQIQSLEEAYDAKLFHRRGGSVSLTKAGESLYKYAEKINVQLASINDKLRSLTDTIDKTIPIGACQITGNYVLPEIVANFNAHHPDITTDLNISIVDDVLKKLRDREIDVAFVNGDIKKDGLIIKILYTDELVLLMPSSHRLSSESKVSLLDVLSEPFIMNNKCDYTKKTIKDYLAQKGIDMRDLRSVLRTGTIESVKRAVSNGCGISIVPRCSVTNGGISIKTTTASFKEGKLTNNYSMIYRKNRDYSPLSARFIKYVSNYPYHRD